MRHPTTSSAVALQRTGGEQQVDSFLITSFSAASSTPTATASAPLVLPLLVLMVLVVLRLQLEAQGGVQSDDAAAGGDKVIFSDYCELM